MVDDEYSYSGYNFAAGGTFSFGGVTVAANQDDDDEEEEEESGLTSMNAADFQYGSYYDEQSEDESDNNS